MDIEVSSDGVLYLMHDASVDRMTNGTGDINMLTSSYINSLTIDAGNNVDCYETQHVPTLNEALYYVKLFGMKAFIEIKENWTAENIQSLISIIESYDMQDNVIIISFSVSLIQLFREYSNMLCALIYGGTLIQNVIDLAIDIGNCGISLVYTENSIIPASFISQMQENNIFYGFWTVDDATIVRTLLSNNKNCAFITSNFNYGHVIKSYTKMCVGIMTENGLIPWAKFAPSNSNSFTYDLFTIAETEQTNVYRFNYVTPLYSHRFNYNGVVNMFVNPSNRISIWASTQDENGFNFRFIDNNTGNIISYAEAFAILGQKFIAISIPCYS